MGELPYKICEEDDAVNPSVDDNETDPPPLVPTVSTHPFPPFPPPVDAPTTRITPLQTPFRQPDDGNDDPNALTIGLAVGSGLVVIVVVVMVMLYYRRQKHSNDKGNKNDDNKKVTNVISGDHVYTDITSGGDVSNRTVRRAELPGDYVTIEDDVDRYDHCRHPTPDTDKQTGTTDTYDSLGSGTRNVSVIVDEPYDTTRDITYDRLHDKQNKSSIPGNYDVLPV
ncbi:uncharacterized protein LOC110448395 [Mizuhopecten yessoensis]|uniref:uncharacterized protein LOC110448395 n=1 Tax=Mizuhopecten yessoensis TaxID=6573 RepID=UPI000B457C79|nr:uncharacterized protein LOC110448395 [Mizuhopecten yessoensis]